MKESNDNCFQNNFSHIYVEKKVLNHPLAKTILAKFSEANIILIDHYKDVFARKKQNFLLQKNARKIILAEKKGQLMYPGPNVCHNFGNRNFYYCSCILNCVYDCKYCYLQGAYPSAYIVIFLNIYDHFNEATRLLENHPLYLSVSYDSDLLALEKVIPYTSMWIEYARKKNNNLLIEIRTKSANFNAIKHLPPCENVILAWTLSPQEIIHLYEHKTPSLFARLNKIKNAIDAGWKVRICFDPILYIENWETYYKKCINQTFSFLPQEKIHDISIGVFRIAKDYLKNIYKLDLNCDILYYPFCCNNGVYSYPRNIRKQLIESIYNLTQKYIPENKIFILD